MVVPLATGTWYVCNDDNTANLQLQLHVGVNLVNKVKLDFWKAMKDQLGMY